MRTEQHSHHTRNSAALTSAFPIFITGSLFLLAKMIPFENVKRWRHYSRLGDGIQAKDRSGTAFRPARAELLRRYDREQIELALGISGKTHQDTILYQLWTNGQYASGFTTHNEVANTQQ
jgi:hypothetical protein